MDIESTVKRLSDLESIRDLAHRYAHNVWASDAEALVQLFVEDGEMDTGDREPARGRTALRQMYGQSITAGSFQPFVHNHVICLDGDAATGVCYLDLRVPTEKETLLGVGYYVDSYARTGDGWKFRTRKLHMSNWVPLAVGGTDSIIQSQG